MNDRDLLQALADLAHLCAGRPDRPSFASSLVLRVLRPFGARATAIGILDAQGRLDVRTTFGFAPGVLRDGPRYDLDDAFPLTHAVRTGRVVDGSLSTLESTYPALTPLDLRGEHMIAIPVTERGATVGGMAVLTEIAPDYASTAVFWNAVAALVATAIGVEDSTGSFRDRSRHAGPMTERQLQILRLVQHGLTNGQIAKAMNFGTSTIGHDIMRIFDVLGVASRRAAVAEAEREGILPPMARVEDEAVG